ncbi:MAG: ABC transporter substrate-binding protein [Egibacteraceae bacterium]
MRRTAALILAAALVTVSGLGPAAATEDVTSAFPVTVENCGRRLTFDEPPSRVVTGYHPVFETLVSLGVGEEQIVGRTNFSENGPDGFLPGQREVYDAIPEISPDIEFPQKEALLALEPDFVIAVSYSDFDASRGFATVQELADAGIPAFIAGNWCDPEGVRNARIADIFDDIRNLGLIFGVPDRAAELIADLEGILADVEGRVAGLEPVDVLATDGGSGPVNAYGGRGFMHQMIEIAGGRNVLADIDEYGAELSVERIATSDPEAMLVLDYDVLFGETVPSAEEKADTVFALIPDSSAARDRRFLPVPAVATHSGYHNILAIPEIAAFLHPGAFQESGT